MSLLQTRYWIVVCNGCPAYLVPPHMLHPNPGGRPLNCPMIADSPAARTAARAAGWITGIKVTHRGRDPEWIDLCPDCITTAEKQARTQTGRGVTP